ncbi:MAG: 50S ribosomal protein L29 [Candidatus Brocadiales bacterium]
MKTNELRGKSRQEILDEIEGCKRELFNLRFQWQSGELRNSSQYKKTGRDIARLNTILREMELGINKHLYAKENSSI